MTASDRAAPLDLARDLERAEEHDLFGRYDQAVDGLDRLIVAARAAATVTPVLVVALVRRAALARYAGQLVAAEALLAEAREVVTAHRVVGVECVCELESERGHLYLEMAGPDAAEPHLVRAVDLARSIEPGHERAVLLASSLTVLAVSRRLAGNYAAADTLLQEAIRGTVWAYETDPTDRRAGMALVHALDELGVLHKFSGDFPASEVAYQRALALLEAIGGPHHPDVATIQHNLGGLAHARGDGPTAEQFARRSVALHERSLGPDHLATVLDRSALAAILDQQGATAEAEALLRDCARRLERTLGPEHRELSVVLNNLGAIAQRAGRLDEAHALYARTAEIKARVLGPAAPSLAITLNNLATIQRRLGRLDVAAATYERALDILLRSADPDHPHVALVRRNLARLDADERASVSDS